MSNSTGNLVMALLLMLTIFCAFNIFWPRKKDRYPGTERLAQLVARQGSKIKCTCGFWFACPPCSARMDAHDQAIQRGEDKKDA